MKPRASGGSRKKKPSSASKQLRSEREEIVETDPDTGCKVRVTRIKCGILRTETRHYDTPDGMFAAMSELAKYSPRESLERHCDELRNYLKNRELPTDRQPWWVKAEEGWREFTDADEKLRLTRRLSHWTKRIEELTDPLSPERAAGKLLFCLNQVLGRKDIDEHLWDINQLLVAFAVYQIAGHANDLAHAGKLARAGRRKGPQARREKGDKIRKIATAHAFSYWEEHPAYRGNVSSTAEAIAEAVNEELRSKGLLQSGRRGISVKRIGDYIREGIRG